MRTVTQQTECGYRELRVIFGLSARTQWNQNNASWEGPGRRNAPADSLARELLRPTLRQDTSKRSAICSACAPSPRMREPKFGSFNFPPRIERIRLRIFSF